MLVLLSVLVAAGFGESGRFRYKAKYPLLTRLAYCQCLMRQVFMSVFSNFEWTDVSLITDRSELHARGLGESLDEGFQVGGIFPHIVAYYSAEKFDYKDLLEQASRKARGQSGSTQIAKAIVWFKEGLINLNLTIFFFFFRLFPIRGRHSGFSFSSCFYELYLPPSLQPQPWHLSPHP